MSQYISKKLTQFSGTQGAEILLVSEWATEEGPFSSEELNLLAKALPISLHQCALASLSSYKPANNDFSYLDGSPELAESKLHLEAYISAHPPKIIISFGEKCLNYFAGEYNIFNWRGSPLRYKGINFLPTLSLRTFGTFTTVAFDIGKGIEYLNGRTVRRYNDNFTIASDPLEQDALFQEILAADKVTIDIETKRDKELTLLCVGFGLSAERAICMPVKSEFTKELLRRNIPLIKNPIYHNGIFDLTVLREFHQIPANPAVFDTLVAQHVVAPEMPKDLGFICSVFTWRPCYWGSVKFDDDKTWNEKRSLEDLYIYNCKDVCVTYEAYEKLAEEISADKDFQHIFNFEMETMEVAMHISNSGFNVDQERKNLLATYITKKRLEEYTYLFAIGGKKINMASPKQVKDFLYTDLELPVRKNRDGSITTGEDALVSLIAYCKGERAKLRTDEAKLKWQKREAILKIMLNIREYDKLLSSYVGVEISADGRLRGWYKSSSTESGRWAGGVYLDGTGLNPQTLPRKTIDIPEDESAKV